VQSFHSKGTLWDGFGPTFERQEVIRRSSERALRSDEKMEATILAAIRREPAHLLSARARPERERERGALG